MTTELKAFIQQNAMISLCLFNVEFVIPPRQREPAFQHVTYIFWCKLSAASSRSINRIFKLIGIRRVERIAHGLEKV